MNLGKSTTLKAMASIRPSYDLPGKPEIRPYYLMLSISTSHSHRHSSTNNRLSVAGSGFRCGLASALPACQGLTVNIPTRNGFS
jgi:hypothetical protein